MRICIGLTEIASLAAAYASGFRQLGHEVYTVVTSRHPFYLDASYDRVIDESLNLPLNPTSPLAKARREFCRRAYRTQLFNDLLPQTDLFVYLFGTSFLPRYADYRRIRQAGKQLVSIFLGSDTRHWYPFQQEMQSLGLAAEVQPFIDGIRAREIEGLPAKLRRVKAAEQHANLILSQPGNGQLQTRPYMRMTIPLDLSQYRCQIPLRPHPCVLHAPSWRVGKGTSEILTAVENLHNAGVEFDFQLIENTPNAQVREMLSEADIVVDELYADTVGVLSTEAMAAGCAVLVHYPAAYAQVAPDCPAVNITDETLSDRLRAVILDLDLRRQLAEAGRPYVEAHHDHLQITRQILSWLQPEGIAAYDFTPTFHRQLHIPAWVHAEDRGRNWAVWLQRWRNLWTTKKAKS